MTLTTTDQCTVISKLLQKYEGLIDKVISDDEELNNVESTATIAYVYMGK